MRLVFLAAAFIAVTGYHPRLQDHDGEGLVHHRRLQQTVFGPVRRIPDEEHNAEEMHLNENPSVRPGSIRPGKDFAHCVQVGMVVDQSMVDLIGGEDACREYFRTMLVEISAYYMREWNAKLRLKEFIVHNSWGNKNTGDSRLDEMQRMFANNNGDYNNRKEDANLWVHATARELDGGGIAWMEGLFSYKYQFGVVLGMEGPTNRENWAKWDLMVMAHEIGHLFGADHTHEMRVGGDYIDRCASRCNQDIPTRCDPNSPNALSDSGGFCGSIMSYCHICSSGPGDMDNVVFDFHDANQQAVDRLFTQYETNYDLVDATCDSNGGGNNGGNSGGGDTEDSPEECTPDCESAGRCDWASDGCGGWCSNSCPCQSSCEDRCGGVSDGCSGTCDAQCTGDRACEDTPDYTDPHGYACWAWRADWGFFCGDNDNQCYPGYSDAECRAVRQNCTNSCDLCGEAWVFESSPSDQPSEPPVDPSEQPSDPPVDPSDQPSDPPTPGPSSGGGSGGVDCGSITVKFNCNNDTEGQCTWTKLGGGRGMICEPAGGGDDEEEEEEEEEQFDCSTLTKKNKCKKKNVGGAKPCRWDPAPLRHAVPHQKGGCVSKALWTAEGKMCYSDAEAICNEYNNQKNACKRTPGTKVCKFSGSTKNCSPNKPSTYDGDC